jgi:hypothetical protein
VVVQAGRGVEGVAGVVRHFGGFAAVVNAVEEKDVLAVVAGSEGRGGRP